MSKKKETRKEKIKFFVNEAKYYNNVGQYKKAAKNIRLAKGIWMEYKKNNSKTRKLLSMIIKAEEIIADNYIASKEKEIYNILNVDGIVKIKE